MTIDFSKLPKPDLIEELNFETILAARKARLIELFPSVADVIDNESEPLNFALQEQSYRELILRQRINEAALARTLAYAEKSDLDFIGEEEFESPRLLITPADNSTTPPTAAVYESDETYRQRLSLVRDEYSTAGPRGAYESIARKADVDVAAAKAKFISDGHVSIFIVTHNNFGIAQQSTIDAVEAAVSDDDVRPMTDYVTIEQSPVTYVPVTAALEFEDTLDTTGVAETLAASEAALIEYQTTRAIGEIIAVSKLHSIIHVPGIKRVTLSNPTADIDPGETGTAVISNITLNTAGA